jgi:5-methylcytosine-specific restriction endonuclease McrA
MLNEHNTTLDHVIPRYAGGETVRNNLIAACFGCNSNKSGKEWRGWFRTKTYWTECRERYIEEWLEQ